MLKDYRILLVLSIVAALAVALSVWDELSPEYQEHQKKYYALSNSDNYEISIRQINQKTPRGLMLDRCASCHMGATNEKAWNFPQPLKMHPPIVSGVLKDPHDLDKIGCVICHDGNGRALEKDDAHGEYHDWYAPLLRGKEAQAGCSNCHFTQGKDLAGAELYNRGKRLFFEKACWSCHTIEGVSAGKSAPDLTDAGRKFSIEYLKKSIEKPTDNTATSKMPKFDWIKNKGIVKALVVYLKGQRKERLRDSKNAPVELQGESLKYVSITKPSVAAGKRIFMGESTDSGYTRGGCINCHSLRSSEGKLFGGTEAPELTYEIRARGKKYMRNHIRHPRNDVIDSIMPSFDLYTDIEIESLVMFLSTFDYKLAGGPSITGEQLFKTYCASCHNVKLDGRGPVSKLLDPLPRNFTKRQFVSSYSDRFKDSVRKGVTGTAMPPWENMLTEAEIDKLIDYIKAVTTKKGSRFVRYEVSLPQAGDLERRDYKKKGTRLVKADADRGRKAFQKFCTSCHGKLATGKGPSAYALEHPLPRNLINEKFFSQASVTDERLYRSILLGVPGTPMPSHDHLKDQTILDIIQYIRSIAKTKE